MANTFYEGIVFYERIGSVEPNTVWVEIGSERGEGSTMALAGQAQRWGTHLYSVDIDSHARDTLQHPCLTCFVDQGSQWAKNTWPELAQKISLLHLDNFDWTWDIRHVAPWIQKQIHDYQQRFGIVMNNENCQQEHFEQIVLLTPYLADQCLVVLDDTYMNNGTWTGKSGPGVVYLKHQGFRCIHLTPTGGTVLARGFDQLKPVDTTVLI